jgi:glycosyltransferase involved in cell wall biosynthesis
MACYSHERNPKIPENIPFKIHKCHIPPLIYKASVGALKSSIYFNFWRRFLRNIFNEFQFDAIHIHDLPLARIGHEFSQRYGIRFTLDLHENWPALLNISTHTNTPFGKILSSNKQWIAYEKRYVQLADNIIVVVEEARKRMMDLGAEASKVHIVSNTLNLEEFNFPDQERDPAYVTMVYGGGVNFHRGIQTVIRALTIIRSKIPNIRLWIIGPGSYLENLKKLARDLEVEKYVHFFGWMNREELLMHISRADVALIPHIRSPHTDNTVPHKLFQYMYAGIPILSSNCAPLERIVNETGTGLIFQNQDPESFAKSLTQLLSDPDFIKKIPENGRRKVEEKYNWNRDAQILRNVYNLA